MHPTVRKSAATVAALGSLGLGGAAIAGAADTSTSSKGSSRGAHPQHEALSSDVAAKVKAAALAEVPGATVLRTEAAGPYDSAYHAHIEKADGTQAVVLVNKSFEATAVEADRGRGGRRGGGHGDHGGAGETALIGATKEKVEAAALAKLPGATIIRTETNNDSTTPYESHVRKSDGTEVEVLVSKSFEVVEVRERPARP